MIAYSMPSPLAKEQLAASLLEMFDALRFNERRREKGKSVQRTREELTLWLISSKSATTVRDIRGILSLISAQMTRVLCSLERQALITTARSRNDRRTVDVALTKKGIAEASTIHAGRIDALVSAMEQIQLGNGGDELMMDFHRQMTEALGKGALQATAGSA